MEAAAAGERRTEASQRDRQSSVDFFRGPARPATPLMFCRVLSEHGLPIAPSTYDDHLDRTTSRRAEVQPVMLTEPGPWLFSC